VAAVLLAREEADEAIADPKETRIGVPQDLPLQMSDFWGGRQGVRRWDFCPLARTSSRLAPLITSAKAMPLWGSTWRDLEAETLGRKSVTVSDLGAPHSQAKSRRHHGVSTAPRPCHYWDGD
jgi:hypothetical protein